MVANILPANLPYPIPTPTLGKGPQGKILRFQNMVMLHIKLKRITKCSNMVANILPTDLPSPPPSLPHPGIGSTGHTKIFQNMVTFHIKFIGIRKCSNMVANILPADPPTCPPRGQRVKIHFFRTWSCCISN